MTKVTAKQVAQRAGVSIAAVSRAYRSDGAISDEKRQRIFKAAQELGFVSSVDRILSTQATNTIALVLGDMRNPFYPIVADELALHLRERDLRMIVHITPSGEDVDMLMRQVLDYRVEGVILATSSMGSALARECRSNNIPSVLLNRVQSDSQMKAVCCNNYDGSRQMAQHFLDRGRRRIAFIGGRRDTSTHLERMRGFCDLLEEAGLALAADVPAQFSYRAAFSAMEQILRSAPLPEAVFCANDIMAVAALDAARARGVGVPDDIAIAGFDDIPMAAWEAYQLTTVRQPLRRMLQNALDMLVETGRGADEPDIRILPAELQVRRSA